MEHGIYILLILILSSSINAMIGFGNALIFVSLTSLFVDIQTTIVLSAFWNILGGFFNAIKYRQYIDRPYFKWGAPGTVVGGVLGALLLISSDLSIVQILFSVFIIIYVISKVRSMVKEKTHSGRNVPLLEAPSESDLEKHDKKVRSEKTPTTMAKSELKDLNGGIITGGYFTYGFLSGLIGAAGPVSVMVLDARGHTKKSFIANFAVLSNIMSITVVTTYLIKGLFPTDLFWFWLGGIPLIFLAANIGFRITEKISVPKFRMIVLFFLIVIALRSLITASLNLV